MIIEEGHPLWQRLYDEYKSDPKKGYVSVGGRDYKVLKPSADVVKFQPIGGLESNYGSLSL
jgi:hypothetical protein